jgi:hypothetical protein
MLLSKACDVWRGWLCQLVLPDFTGAWLQVLDYLSTLCVDSGLLHPAHMLFDLNVCEELLL